MVNFSSLSAAFMYVQTQNSLRNSIITNLVNMSELRAILSVYLACNQYRLFLAITNYRVPGEGKSKKIGYTDKISVNLKRLTKWYNNIRK